MTIYAGILRRLTVTMAAGCLAAQVGVAQTANPAGAAQSGAVTMAIVGGTLIDGTGTPAQPNMTILVSGGRVQRIGPAGSTPVPAGANVIKADGKFVIPGLIEAHNHYRDYSAELLITHGITSIVDWGGSNLEWILAQKEGTAKGKIYGPRIYTSGEVLGDKDGKTGTVEAVVKRIRELKERGVDKIDLGFDVSPEVMKAAIDEAHRLGLPISGYPLWGRKAVELGIDLIKHTHSLARANTTDMAKLQQLQRDNDEGIYGDVSPCVFTKPFDDLMNLMVAKKTIWDATLIKDYKAVTDRRDEFAKESLDLIGNPELAYLPVQDLLLQLVNVSTDGIKDSQCGPIGTFDRSSPDYEMFQRSYRDIKEFIGKFVKAGGRVVGGVNPQAYVLPGISLHHELLVFVDSGLTPMQALHSVGLWAAQYIRAEKDIGTLQPGTFADIVILTKNPLDDIRNARAIETVIQGGRVMQTGYHRWFKNPIARNNEVDTSSGNPPPVLQRISPVVATEGSGDVALKVTGRRFFWNSVVFLGDKRLETKYVSPAELTAVIPAKLLQEVGNYSVYVFTPRPVGGRSSTTSFIVKY